MSTYNENGEYLHYSPYYAVGGIKRETEKRPYYQSQFPARQILWTRIYFLLHVRQPLAEFSELRYQLIEWPLPVERRGRV